jgi:hypothetical protein
MSTSTESISPALQNLLNNYVSSAGQTAAQASAAQAAEQAIVQVITASPALLNEFNAEAGNVAGDSSVLTAILAAPPAGSNLFNTGAYSVNTTTLNFNNGTVGATDSSYMVSSVPTLIGTALLSC